MQRSTLNNWESEEGRESWRRTQEHEPKIRGRITGEQWKNWRRTNEELKQKTKETLSYILKCYESNAPTSEEAWHFSHRLPPHHFLLRTILAGTNGFWHPRPGPTGKQKVWRASRKQEGSKTAPSFSPICESRWKKMFMRNWKQRSNYFYVIRRKKSSQATMKSI